MGSEGDAPSMPLFTPYKMGPFELSHRIAYAPLTRCRAIGTIPQAGAITYYSQRATKGGFMLAEGTCVSQEGHGYPNVPGVYTEEQVEAWKPITKAIHEKGAVIFCQIWHVGRASHQEYQPGGALPIAPSAVAIGSEYQVYISTGPAAYPTPRALEASEIPSVVEQFRVAARNALRAGFDGVEIHGANGYLVDQFLKDGMNFRTDEYGGSVENRARFCCEVVDAVVEEIGAERVGIRLSPFGGFLDASDSDPFATNLYLMDHFNKKNLLYVHFVEPRVGGNNDREIPEGATVEPFRKAFKGTFLSAGGHTCDTGNEAVASGHADIIVYGRLYLANPDLPKRFALGAALNKYDRSTFYTSDQVVGYSDYPFLEEVKET